MKRKNKEKLINKAIDFLENRLKNKYLCDFEIDRNDVIDHVLGKEVRLVKESFKPIKYLVAKDGRDFYSDLFETHELCSISDTGELMFKKKK